MSTTPMSLTPCITHFTHLCHSIIYLSMFQVPHVLITKILPQQLISNEVSLVHRCENIPPLSTSDHYGIVVTINKKYRKHRIMNKGRKIWRYSYAIWDGACEAIDDFDWDSIISDDIDVACENWLNEFMQKMEQYIPKV